jgi:hypothetical protein
MSTETQITISPDDVAVVTLSDQNWLGTKMIQWLKSLRDRGLSGYASGFLEVRDGSKCLRRYVQLAPYDAEAFVAQVQSLHSKRCQVRISKEGAEFIEALVDCEPAPSGVCTDRG